MDAVLAELSAPQLAEWQAYYCLEPFGNEWMQTALLASLIAESNRDAEKREEPFTVDEFMPHPLDTKVVLEAASAPEPAEEPWRAWKKAFQVMAEASKAATLAEVGKEA